MKTVFNKFLKISLLLFAMTPGGALGGISVDPNNKFNVQVTQPESDHLIRVLQASLPLKSLFCVESLGFDPNYCEIEPETKTPTTPSGRLEDDAFSKLNPTLEDMQNAVLEARGSYAEIKIERLECNVSESTCTVSYGSGSPVPDLGY